MPPVNPTLFYQLLGPYSARTDIIGYTPGLSVNGGGAGYVSRYETPLAGTKKGEEWLWNDFNTHTIDQNAAAGHGQYDSAYREYAWYAMTGNETYFTRGNAFAAAYRDVYIIPNNYGPASENTNSRGLAMHYAATGEEASRTAVGGIARTAIGDNLTFGWTRYSRTRPKPAADQRIWTRAMEAAIYAAVLDAPYPGGGTRPDFTAVATQCKNDLLAVRTIYTDNVWRSTESNLLVTNTGNPATSTFDYNTQVVQPFFTHILWNGLLDYNRLISSSDQANIMAAIETAATYHFESTAYGPSYTGPGSGGNLPGYPTGIWTPVPNDECNYYTEASKGYWSAGDNYGEIVTKGSRYQWLNGFMLPGIARLYATTGDVKWKNRANLLLNGMQGADFDGIAARPFNEMYAMSWKAFPDLIGPAVNLKKIRLKWK